MAESQPDHVLFWLKEGTPSPLIPGTTSTNLAVSPEGSLRLSSVTPADEGSYSCAAVSESGSNLVSVFVSVKRSRTVPPPIIQLGPVNQTLPTNGSARFPCQFTSRARATVTWLKEGLPIDTTASDGRYSVVGGSSLNIDGNCC